MILNRLGNKKAIASEIQKYFPEHKIYIEPFFGAGGMFFNKPKARYNFLNDIDSDIFNLYNVILDKKNDFLYALEITPYSSELFEYWKKNKEFEPIKKALRFVYLSNYGYLGKPNSIQYNIQNNKKQAVIKLNRTINFLKDCDIQFMNFDFRKVYKSIAFRQDVEKSKVLIYCDPPYLGTNDNYSHSFTEQDSIDLFDTLQATGCKFAMSEFDNEFILNQAKKRGLNVIVIGERKNLKNRRTEILITNYEKQKSLFD